MNKLEILKKSIAAGIMIGIGGSVYMLCGNKIVGAVLFSIGLLCICTFGLNLYTGKVGYVLDNKNWLDCALIWLGNLIGCFIMGIMMRVSKPQICETAAEIVKNKLSQSIPAAIFLGMLCGVLIYVAVENFKTNADGFSRVIGIFTYIPVFILCGFEHSVADMYYFILGVNSMELIGESAAFILIVTAANALGSILFKELMRTVK